MPRGLGASVDCRLWWSGQHASIYMLLGGVEVAISREFGAGIGTVAHEVVQG